MTYRQYCSDQKWLLLTFYFILLFISILITVEPSLRITANNYFYLVGNSVLIFNIYFTISYFAKKQQLEKWKNLNLVTLPTKVSHEQQIYFDSFKQVEENYLKQIHDRNMGSKEQLEFMTLWFHEIKTPIAVSQLLLQTQIDSPSLQEELNKIEGFVEQALYFSRLHEFNKDYLIQEIELEKLIKEIIKQESNSFISRKIAIQLELAPMAILSDKKGLTYIIRQILSNSLKYTNERGKITIQLNPESRELVILDTGIGIPPEDLPRVFDKGFTGINGRTHQRSTGMGLYLAKKTAEKLGHPLSIDSSVGKGTQVILDFPEMSDPYHQL
ncbi:ATP-binding protein [Neobacillus sp. Marseille-QA0830]